MTDTSVKRSLKGAVTGLLDLIPRAVGTAHKTLDIVDHTLEGVDKEVQSIFTADELQEDKPTGQS